MNNIFIIVIKGLTNDVFNNYRDTNGFNFFSEKGIVGDIENIDKFNDIICDKDKTLIHNYFPGYLKMTYSIERPVKDLKESIEKYGFWYGNEYPNVHKSLPVDITPLLSFITSAQRPFFILWSIDSMEHGFDKFPYVNSSLIEIFSTLKLLKLFKNTVVLIVGYETKKTPFIYVSPETYESEITLGRNDKGKIEKEKLFDMIKGERSE